MPKVGRAHSGHALSSRIHVRPDIGTGDDPMDSTLPPSMVAGSPAFSRLNSLEQSVMSGGGSSGPSGSHPGSPAGSRPTNGSYTSASSGGASSCNGSGNSPMPPQIMERIWDENLRFLRNKQLFQPDYFRFLMALLKRAPLPQQAAEQVQLSAGGSVEEIDAEDAWIHVQLGVTFLTDVLAHAKYATNPLSYSKDVAGRRALGEEEDLPPPGPLRLRAVGGRLGIEHRTEMLVDCTPAPHSLLNEYKVIVQSLLEAHLPAASWFLRDVLIPSRLRLRYFLFDCGSQLMRDMLVELCATVMRVVAPTERHVYDKQDEVEVKPTVASAASASAAAATPIDVPPVSTVATAQESSSPGSGAGGSSGPQIILVNRSLVLQFIDQVMQLWRELQWQWRSLSQYFSLLHAFAEMGYNERKYLLQVHEVIKQAVDLYMGDLSPYARQEKYRRPVMGDLDTQPNWFHTFALLATLLCSTLTTPPVDPEQTLLPPTFLSVQHGTVPLPVRGDATDLALQKLAAADEAARHPSGSDTAVVVGENGEPVPPPPEPQSARWVILARPSDEELTHTYQVINAPVLSGPDSEMIYNQDFVSKLLRDGCNPDANRLLVVHVCFGHPPVDMFVCRTWLKLMDEANYDRFAGLLSLLPPLLALQDVPLAQERVERYLNPRTGLIYKADHWASSYPIFTFIVLKWLMLEIGRVEGHPARDYLIAHKDELYWALRWFHNYHQRELHARASKPTTPTQAELQRVAEAQQTTMDALIDWFGNDWIVDRQQRDKIAAEQYKAEQAARKAAPVPARAAVAPIPVGDDPSGVDPLVAASGAAVSVAQGGRGGAGVGGHIGRNMQQPLILEHDDYDDDHDDNERPDQTDTGFAFGDTDDDDADDDLRGRVQSPGGSGAGHFSDPDDLDASDEGMLTGAGGGIGGNGGGGAGGSGGKVGDSDDDDDDEDDTIIQRDHESNLARMRGLGIQGRGLIRIAGGSGGGVPLTRGGGGMPPPLTSAGNPWPIGGGLVSGGGAIGGLAGAADDDDDGLNSYMDADDDPVEMVRKFEEEQQRKAAGGGGGQ
jgi:hypothetical protein